MSNTSKNQVTTTTDNKGTKGPGIVVKDYNKEAPDDDWVKIVFNIDEKIGKLKPIHECEDNKSHQVVLYVVKGATWKDIAYYIPEVEFTGDKKDQYPRWTPEFPDNDKTTAENGGNKFTVSPVHNPWEEFFKNDEEDPYRKRDQYIATGDRGYIARYMHEKQSSKLVFNTLPGPFFGNITTAKVVLLLNNPGLRTQEDNNEKSADAEDAKCNFWRSMALKCLKDDFGKCSGYYFIDPTRDLESQLGEDILNAGEVGDEIDLSYLSNEYYHRAQRLLFKAYGIEIEEKDDAKKHFKEEIERFESKYQNKINNNTELAKAIETAKREHKRPKINVKIEMEKLRYAVLKAISGGIEWVPKDDNKKPKIIFHEVDPLEKKRVRLLTLVGTLYWQKEIEPLIKPPVTHDDLLKHFAFINHFPYHSENSREEKFHHEELRKLPTRKYTAQLLKKAIDNHATIILARAEDSNKKWYEEYFGSQSFTYHYRCTDPQHWSFKKMLTREECDEMKTLTNTFKDEHTPKNFKCLKEKFKEA